MGLKKSEDFNGVIGEALCLKDDFEINLFGNRYGEKYSMLGISVNYCN